MFGVGKHYRFKMWSPGAGGGAITESALYTVNAVELPLVKVFDRVHGELVVNTASHAFVSAREVMSVND